MIVHMYLGIVSKRSHACMRKETCLLEQVLAGEASRLAALHAASHQPADGGGRSLFMYLYDGDDACAMNPTLQATVHSMRDCC